MRVRAVFYIESRKVNVFLLPSFRTSECFSTSEWWEDLRFTTTFHLRTVDRSIIPPSTGEGVKIHLTSWLLISPLKPHTVLWENPGMPPLFVQWVSHHLPERIWATCDFQLLIIGCWLHFLLNPCSNMPSFPCSLDFTKQKLLWRSLVISAFINISIHYTA